MADKNKNISIGLKQLPAFKWKTTDTAFNKLLSVWKLSGSWNAVGFYENVNERYHHYLPYMGNMDEVEKDAFIPKTDDGFSPYYYTKPFDEPFSYRRETIGWTPSNLTELGNDECLIHIEIIPKQRNKDFKHPVYESKSIAEAEILTLRMVDYVASSKKPFDVSAYGFKHCETLVKQSRPYHSKGGMFVIVKNFSLYKSPIFNFPEFVGNSDFEIRAHYFHRAIELNDSVDLNLWCHSNQKDTSMMLLGDLKRNKRKTKTPVVISAKVGSVYNLTQYRFRRKAYYHPPSMNMDANSEQYSKVDVVPFPPKMNQQSKLGLTHIYNSTNKWLSLLSNGKHKSIFIPLNKWVDKQPSNTSSKPPSNTLEELLSNTDPNALHRPNMKDRNHFKHFYKFNTNTKSTPFYLPPKIWDAENRKLKHHSPQITYPFHLNK
jgi:hypothetical protein